VMYGTVSPEAVDHGARRESRKAVMVTASVLGLMALCASALIINNANSFQSDTILMSGPLGQMLAPNTQHLMEEGSVKLDPNDENPSAAFYANQDALEDEDENIEDAGPGGILDGWTQPELLDPPAPEQMKSFRSRDAAPVFNPVDYQRNPGAVALISSARKKIDNFQDEISKAHEEAEDAKARYEKEQAKTKDLEKDYQAYVQKMQAARAAMAGSHNWSPLKDSSGGVKGNGMWSMPANVAQEQAKYKEAYAKEHQGDQAQDSGALQIDTESENAADQFRKQFYTKNLDPNAQLIQRQAGFKVFRGQNLRQMPSGFRPATARSEERLQSEEAAMRESAERANLERDEARLQLARSRLAQAERHPRFAMRGRGLVEGCPEGTPGCDRITNLRMSHDRRVVDPTERRMMTAGDSMVPVEQAEVQRPKLIGEGLFN